jgi:hypothetical protein
MLKRLALAAGFIMVLAGQAIGNDFYTHGNFPAPSSPATSASMRAEFDLISAGFAKLPTITGNAGKVVVVNGGATGLTTTTGQLSLAGNFSVTGAFDTTFIQVASTTLTLPAVSGTLATLDGLEVFTNKSIAGSQITSAVSNAVSATIANTVVTNANLSGPITSAGNTTSVTAQTGTGSTFVMQNAPSITSPSITSPSITGTVAGTYTLGGTLGISLFDTKGDFLAATSDDTPAKVSAGSNGTVLMARSQATAGLAYVAALNKAIYGLTYANNAGDATNDLDIAAGGAMDATGAYFMVGSALTKQTDVNWAVGTAAGCLDTGAVGNSDYYLWIIVRSDTGVVDYLCSLSSTAPTMPTNYDFKRLFGWLKRVGGTIVAFRTTEASGSGLRMSWNVTTLDVSVANTLTTARRTDAVKVPLNFSVLAHLDVVIDDASILGVRICSPDETDAAPSDTTAPLTNIKQSVAGVYVATPMDVETSATGLIAARAQTGTVDAYRVSTRGFTWARRN